MKKVFALIMACMMLFVFTACKSTATPKTTFSAAMATDVGGVNDQSFNQSAWEGLQKFSTDTGAASKYLESKQESDYISNLDKLADEKHNIIWGVGFMMAEAMQKTATTYPELKFAIIDVAYDNSPANLTGVVFRTEEPSFLAGYVAGKMTTTNKVGFVGGIKGVVIDTFEYGYRAGVAYAAKELGKNIEVLVQYADSFNDAAIGKAIATTMYQGGADIVFHAAGGVGQGVIEAAKEANKFAIGVDRDQNYLAPKNVLTSVIKQVGQAMYLTSKDVMDGKDVGGKTIAYGLKEGTCDYAKTGNLIPADIITATDAIKADIIAGKIVPPANETDFNAYVAGLK